MCISCPVTLTCSIVVFKLAAVVGIVGRTNASQNVRTACKKCGYGKMIVAFDFV